MGKIWLDYLCQIDHMRPEDTSENESKMKDAEKNDRKIGRVAPLKRKSDANLTQPTEKLVITDDDLSEIDNLSNSTLFERKVAKISSEIEQKMADNLSDRDFRSFGKYAGQFFISIDRIEKFKLADWFNLNQSMNQSEQSIEVKEAMMEFIFGFLEYLGASPQMLQKGLYSPLGATIKFSIRSNGFLGLARFIGENEFSFDVISNAIGVWNADPISKQLSRSIDLYNISNVVESQTESEIDISTLKMLEFCRSGILRKFIKNVLFCSIVNCRVQ